MNGCQASSNSTRMTGLEIHAPPTSKAGRIGSGQASSDLFGRELATGCFELQVALNIAPTRTRRSHSLLLSAYMLPSLAMRPLYLNRQQTGRVLFFREARGTRRWTTLFLSNLLRPNISPAFEPEARPLQQ